MLNIASLSSGYGDLKVLKHVSMHIGIGEIVCILGANGAGKTTLINSITGIIGGKTGRITFNSEDITSLEPGAILRLGIAQVAEGRQLFPAMTVLDNLLLGAYVIRKKKYLIDEQLRRVFESFPILEQRQDQAAGSLSGGEAQMLAIARALMSRPKLILLDEPSLGLAPKIVSEIYRLILGLKKRNTTIVVVEQNARVALSFADRGYVLENGAVILSGTSSELSGNKEVIRAYLGKEDRGIWEL